MGGLSKNVHNQRLAEFVNGDYGVKWCIGESGVKGHFLLMWSSILGKMRQKYNGSI